MSKSIKNSSYVSRLGEFAEKKGLFALKLEEEEFWQLKGRIFGLNKFSIARHHLDFNKVRKNSICLVYVDTLDEKQLYLGVLSSPSAVTTLQSRVQLRFGFELQPKSLSEIANLIPEARHSNRLREIIHDDKEIVKIPAKLSSRIINVLAELDKNKEPLRKLALALSAPEKYDSPIAMQEDAVKTALKTFGLNPDAAPLKVSVKDGEQSALDRLALSEDSVIEHDARQIPEFQLMHSHITGRAVFEQGNERLEIFTANRRPLEEVFGVDLIYFNAPQRNITMLQYKMLERENDDWIFRPDKQFKKELNRMEKFVVDQVPDSNEYRLNSDLFYLKFVKRDGSLKNGGIIVPIAHFEVIQSDPEKRGPKGGQRISYQSLNGCYLKQDAFMSMIRSGYIGSYADTTHKLMTLVELILSQGKAVVAAFQHEAESPEYNV